MIQLIITSDGQNTNINIQTPGGKSAPIRQVLDMISAAENAILGIGIPTQQIEPQKTPKDAPNGRKEK